MVKRASHHPLLPQSERNNWWQSFGNQKITHPHVSVCPEAFEAPPLPPFLSLALLAGSYKSMPAIASSFIIFLFLFVIF